MLRLLAVLRTFFLAFIVYYTIRATPMFFGRVPAQNEAFETCQAANAAFQSALWMAVGWIALETVLGWWLDARERRRERARLEGLDPGIPRPGGEPPFAPPGHR